MKTKSMRSLTVSLKSWPLLTEGTPVNTDLHWFRKPETNGPKDKGTFNPVFELLDHPIVMGHGADEFASGQIELSFEDALDRAAKFAGILRAVAEPAPQMLILEDGLKPATLLLAVLGAMRVGTCAVIGAKGLTPQQKANTPILRPASSGISSDQPQPVGETKARAGMHTSTRTIDTHFEDAELLADGPDSSPKPVDMLMKQAAFKHAAAEPLGPGRTLMRLDGIEVTALESLEAVHTLLR